MSGEGAVEEGHGAATLEQETLDGSRGAELAVCDQAMEVALVAG